MWCIPELTNEYIERMEDILNLYCKSYKKEEPVICFDEKSVQLLEDIRNSKKMKPGYIKKYDSEYKRKGTANIFFIVEPKAGKHYTYVTKRRTKKDFVKVLYRISKKYKCVKKIHIVMDNLNTHKLKSLIEFYGEEKGKNIWNRFRIHYTPKHGSWLNQAEIEIGIHTTQCIGRRRFSDITFLRKETKVWNQIVNKKRIKIVWKFTTKEARIKFNIFK